MSEASKSHGVQGMRLLGKIAVILLSGALFGFGCTDEAPSIYVGSAFHHLGLLLIPLGLALGVAVLLRLSVKRIGLPEGGALLAFVFGIMVGIFSAEAGRKAIFKYDCAHKERSLACFALTPDELRAIGRASQRDRNPRHTR
jgi:hypothetical protein